MPTLSEHASVNTTALSLMKSKGFNLWRDANDGWYWAEKDGWDFCADNPRSLLGLIAIFEAVEPSAFEEYWWRKPVVEADADERDFLGERPEYKSKIRRPVASE